MPKPKTPNERAADEIDDSIEEPVRRMRGMKVVAEALREEDFPMEHIDIDYAVGDVEVEDGKGGYVPVRVLTDHLRKETFNNPQEVLRALHRAVRNLKEKAA